MVSPVRLTLLLLCLSAPVAHAQVITDSILVEGHYRVFHYNQPADTLQQPNRVRPNRVRSNRMRPNLIFVMHGSGAMGWG